MNYLLSVSKKNILIFSALIFVLFASLFFSKYIIDKKNFVDSDDRKISKVDISEPKFSINGGSQNIYVTAKEGNFVDKDKILLKKNVKFESKNFSLFSDDVIFNKKELTAESKKNSTFKSKKTKILSNGFNIYDNGDQIIFIGESKVILE